MHSICFVTFNHEYIFSVSTPFLFTDSVFFPQTEQSPRLWTREMEKSLFTQQPCVGKASGKAWAAPTVLLLIGFKLLHETKIKMVNMFLWSEKELWTALKHFF